MFRPLALIATGIIGLAALSALAPVPEQGQRGWLAGDHHVHSEFSTGYDYSVSPPVPVIGRDARYGISMNAEKAREYGLTWMVSTDHGGPLHSKVNQELAYPALLEARAKVPELLLFYGMEFDTPGADHSSLIIPRTVDERNVLYDIESKWSKRDPFPSDETWDTEPRMVEALIAMRARDPAPVLIANHPSRLAEGLGEYGQYSPREFRDWNDAAPRVAIGMEGSPGRQASALNRDGSIDSTGARGAYSGHPTMGGFDQMTARVGGLWDSMLGEGRRWWITSTSDSHSNWRDGGSDFWPGEYAKTYVFAARTHEEVLEGLRAGRVFVTTGDLISELRVTAQIGNSAPTDIDPGGDVSIARGSVVRITVRIRDPRRNNPRGEDPAVARVDLIAGDITGPAADRSRDTNPTTRVVARFTAAEWRRDGEYISVSHAFEDVEQPMYFRVRGTSARAEAEPSPDPLGENPWADLWFYSNPVFVAIRPR